MGIENALSTLAAGLPESARRGLLRAVAEGGAIALPQPLVESAAGLASLVAAYACARAESFPRMLAVALARILSDGQAYFEQSGRPADRARGPVAILHVSHLVMQAVDPSIGQTREGAAPTVELRNTAGAVMLFVVLQLRDDPLELRRHFEKCSAVGQHASACWMLATMMGHMEVGDWFARVEQRVDIMTQEVAPIAAAVSRRLGARAGGPAAAAGLEYYDGTTGAVVTLPKPPTESRATRLAESLCNVLEKYGPVGGAMILQLLAELAKAERAARAALAAAARLACSKCAVDDVRALIATFVAAHSPEYSPKINGALGALASAAERDRIEPTTAALRAVASVYVVRCADPADDWTPDDFMASFAKLAGLGSGEADQLVADTRSIAAFLPLAFAILPSTDGILEVIASAPEAAIGFGLWPPEEIFGWLPTATLQEEIATLRAIFTSMGGGIVTPGETPADGAVDLVAWRRARKETSPMEYVNEQLAAAGVDLRVDAPGGAAAADGPVCRAVSLGAPPGTAPMARLVRCVEPPPEARGGAAA
jgi:hypothetical protein